MDKKLKATLFSPDGRTLKEWWIQSYSNDGGVMELEIDDENTVVVYPGQNYLIIE